MRRPLAISLIIVSFIAGAVLAYVFLDNRIKTTNAALEEVRRVTLKFMSKIDTYRQLERVRSDSDTVEYLISIDRRGRPIGAVIKDAAKRLEKDSASLQEKRKVLEAEQDESLDSELKRAEKLIGEARFWY